MKSMDAADAMARVGAVTLLLTLVLLLVVLLLLALMLRVRQVENFGVDAGATPRDYGAPELAFPTKCFDCERQFPPGERWRAQPTKCFDCEAQASRPQYTHPNKCFDCESRIQKF